jgi:hypothetical protein
MYEPIETAEQIEAAFQQAEQRIAEGRAMIASVNHPGTPKTVLDAVVSACSLTAARLLDVPAPGQPAETMRG